MLQTKGPSRQTRRLSAQQGPSRDRNTLRERAALAKLSQEGSSRAEGGQGGTVGEPKLRSPVPGRCCQSRC